MMAASGGDLPATVRGKLKPVSPGVRARLLHIEPASRTAERRERNRERERSWKLELGHIEEMQGSPAAFDRANQVLDAIAQSLDGWIISTPAKELEYTEQAQVVKEWSDKTEIIRYFAHKTKSRDLERRASVIRFRLMIRLGELLKGLKDLGLLTHGGARRGSRCTGYNLNDLQIAPHDSANCQAVAELTPEKRKKALKDIEKGTKTINTIVTGLVLNESRDKRIGEIARTAAMDSTFSVILADPPWDHGGDTPNQPHMAPKNHYPVMKEPLIAAYLNTAKVKVGEDAVLFLWAVVPLLDQAFRILSAWGFKYKSMVVWDKRIPTRTGAWLPIQTELLLIGTKGKKMTPPGAKRRQISTNLIPVKKTGHSVKPPQFHDLIERLYPGLPARAELFPRKLRDGWVPFGNDLALRRIA